MSDDWPIPDGLPAKGRAAAEVIVAFLEDRDLQWHGGGGKFYTPQQWRDRDEEYGTNSLLIVVHDGGCIADVMYGNPDLREALRLELEKLNLLAEACTGWYSAVYPL